ncbi:MAG: MATE family efflux transporter [Anaerolineaceae bacterium]|nr:MATE family efflux transporter [Anaerolineaceae bacterium]
MEKPKRMTEGPIAGAIIRFAVPLFLGNLFQQMYNSVDSLIVGNFLGNSALAAVSATGTLIQLMIGFFQGVFLGAGVLVARYFGAQLDDPLRRAIHTTITIALTVGVFLSVVGMLFTPTILGWMGTPQDIFDQTVSYIRVYFAGSLGLILYNACTGIMQAVGDSKHPLFYLVISSLTNVFLDILFIAVFHWGVFSAALATIIAQFLSATLCVIRLSRNKDASRLEFKRLGYDLDMIRQIINFGLPSGLQNSIINFANVIVQSNINSFGTMAVAGCGAYSKIDGFAFLPVTSFNAAMTTFIGQNLGAKQYDRAKRGSRFGLLCSITIAELIGVLLILFGPTLIAAFTNEPEAIRYGLDKLHISAPFFCLLAASHGLAAVLRGAGKAKIPMLVMLCCWCIFRVTFISIMIPLTHSINAVNWVYPITWSMSAVILIIYYVKADWVHGLDLK